MPTIKSTTYSVFVNTNNFEALTSFLKKSSYSKYIILCDENTIEHCLPALLFNCPELNIAEIIELESGEQHKTIETCLQVWGALTDIQADKRTLLINLGGGVITDLGGFVASTFKRGIDFVNLPTTLLSMTDASVGGKTGVNFESIKNHIGIITEPKAVFVFTDFLKTLSQRQLKNGYAEIVKIALINDSVFWDELKTLTTTTQFCNEQIITKAIELKNAIVKKDLHEQNIRKALNFGHSIGHALESAFINQNKDILHGEAIALGMIIESRIAYKLNYLTKKELSEIENYIVSIYKKITITKNTQTLLLSYILQDKKNESDALCFALPKHIGNYELCFTITKQHICDAIALH